MSSGVKDLLSVYIGVFTIAIGCNPSALAESDTTRNRVQGQVQSLLNQPSLAREDCMQVVLLSDVDNLLDVFENEPQFKRLCSEHKSTLQVIIDTRLQRLESLGSLDEDTEATIISPYTEQPPSQTSASENLNRLLNLADLLKSWSDQDEPGSVYTPPSMRDSQNPIKSPRTARQDTPLVLRGSPTNPNKLGPQEIYPLIDGRGRRVPHDEENRPPMRLQEEVD